MLKLAYIASPSYSGSTLLTFLLGAHPAVATMGELKWGELDLETYRCSCGALLRECTFWQAVADRMQARGLPFDLRRPATAFRCRSSRLADRAARAEVRGPVLETLRNLALATLPEARQSHALARQVNRALIEIMLELRGGALFVDASKEPVRLNFLRRTSDYEVWIIHMIRDGRGVTNSFMRHKGMPAAQGALEWRRTHEQLERLRPSFDPTRWLVLSYERLCRQPQEQMNELCRFLQLEPFDVLRELRTEAQHVLGNQMRLRVGERIALDEKWRTTLTAGDLATFERVAGAWNRRYGYE